MIESHWLFSVPWENIAVVVHPQSTIHSMVEFDDGSVKAQLGPPSMRLPIQYALFYPKPDCQRRHSAPGHRDTVVPGLLSLCNRERYPCFGLAVAAGRSGGTAPTVLSAADEVAVQAFLQGSIGFTGIYRVVEQGAGRTSRAARAGSGRHNTGRPLGQRPCRRNCRRRAKPIIRYNVEWHSAIGATAGNAAGCTGDGGSDADGAALPTIGKCSTLRLRHSA